MPKKDKQDKPEPSAAQVTASGSTQETTAEPSGPKSAKPEKMQELFLPVHGHVELHAEEVAILDHPAFQRLRRVRQLGLAHMVFPGATHSRFEHSVGAVHVAQLIVDHVNKNYDTAAKDHSQWVISQITRPMARFIRLGALLHDVGHLPFGHTLEDELNHLPHHDGPERLERVAKIPYLEHEVDHHLIPANEKPDEGWSLKKLIDRLYKSWSDELGKVQFSPFTILSHIVCKPPRHDARRQQWNEEAANLEGHFKLRVCQDIVGNTICADFLDYLHRDWYHLGKPLYFDKRLYQYMEVRTPSAPEDGDRQPRFVINVGPSDNIRHDALTDILELLNSRYKLAQTVLFHRTKLSLTGLLDRCLLEIADLYEKASFSSNKFAQIFEELLLVASDDGMLLLLEHLARGGDTDGAARFSAIIAKERNAIQREVTGNKEGAIPQPTLIGAENPSPEAPPKAADVDDVVVLGEFERQQRLALQLIHKLRDRDVYSLGYKLRMSDFTGPRKPENPRLTKLIRLYKEPKNRVQFLRAMEALCDFPPGTLILNCPSDAAMNAKIARVSLYIEGEVTSFDRYDEGDSSLTRGALWAQIKRFYELWAASIYVDRRIWDGLTETQRKHLKSLLGDFFFQMNPEVDPKIIRSQMQVSIKEFQGRASRAGSEDPAKNRWRAFTFPSGLPFGLEEGG